MLLVMQANNVQVPCVSDADRLRNPTEGGIAEAGRHRKTLAIGGKPVAPSTDELWQLLKLTSEDTGMTASTEATTVPGARPKVLPATAAACREGVTRREAK
jgi:hypothetical protein